jgi:hypothetical protein
MEMSLHLVAQVTYHLSAFSLRNSMIYCMIIQGCKNE